jgi:hypothetical protein
MIGSIAAHWISSYGYWGLTALLMLGIGGLPVPDETLLTFPGLQGGIAVGAQNCLSVFGGAQ